MEMRRYIRDRQQRIEEIIQGYIDEYYADAVTAEMLAYATLGGKHLRGVATMMLCEAAGGKPEDAQMAACAVEICQAASLIKDDIMDESCVRRGRPAFWKKYGFDTALLASDIMVPQAILSIVPYDFAASQAVLTAWNKMAHGQLYDSLPFPSSEGSTTYEKILGLKTASLWEVACELGVRAARQEHLADPAISYGFSIGMAFQLYDDAVDLYRAIGKPWHTVADSPNLPSSLNALRSITGSTALVQEEYYLFTLKIGQRYLRQARHGAYAFPVSQHQNFLIEFPDYCCNALLSEGISVGLPGPDSAALPGFRAMR